MWLNTAQDDGGTVRRIRTVTLSPPRYRDTVGALPWGEGPDTWNHWSAHALLLPYLEQDAPFHALDFTASAAHPGDVANSTGQRITLALLLCPSDLDRLTAPEGHVNYGTDAGTDHDFAAAGPPSGLFRQSPYTPGPVRYPDIVDGLSQTAAVSERVKGAANQSGAPDSLTPSSSLVEALGLRAARPPRRTITEPA